MIILGIWNHNIGNYSGHYIKPLDVSMAYAEPAVHSHGRFLLSHLCIKD